MAGRRITEKEFGGIVLSILLLIGTIIYISRTLFPYFRAFTIILSIALVLSVLVEIFFREHEYLEFWDYVSVYIFIGFLVCLFGVFTTYTIGYGFSETSVGKMGLEFYDAMVGIDYQLQQSINQLVEDSCKSLSKESCDNLRSAVKTAETLQDVQDMVDKLKTAEKVAQTVPK